jgi:hypothetical protein
MEAIARADSPVVLPHALQKAWYFSLTRTA